ncbi:hypothetical protein [Muricomes intestini]|jgi:hypothetical protein|uniref:hypothetical protein n=1 Tax=Muricomes intestini TaxID=1796634 RepID=UPI002FD9FEF9
MSEDITTNEEIVETPTGASVDSEDTHVTPEDIHMNSEETSDGPKTTSQDCRTEPEPAREVPPAAKFHSQTVDEDEMPEDSTSSKGFLRLKRKDREFSRDEWILAHIDNAHLMEYLQLEQQRSELLQKTKDIRDRRILKAFELTISLAAAVAIVSLLKDNPSILINILYIAGIVIALWLWKNPREK